MERWGLADTNGKIVIPPEYDAVGVYRYSGQLISMPVLTEFLRQEYLIPQAPVKPEFSPTHLGWISTEFFIFYKSTKSEKK